MCPHSPMLHTTHINQKVYTTYILWNDFHKVNNFVSKNQKYFTIENLKTLQTMPSVTTYKGIIASLFKEKPWRGSVLL